MRDRGIAHRGYPGRYPENTLASFQAAAELGFTRLELDAQPTRDGVPVVLHDLRVDRMTEGTGYVMEMSLEELRRLRVAGTEPIPTLEEALRLLRGKLEVNIELKQFGQRYPGLETAVLDVVKRLDMADQVFLTSFDEFSIRRLRELDADIAAGFIHHGSTTAVFPLMRQLKAAYLAVNHLYITPEYAALCEEEGISLIAYTVDEAEEMKRLLACPSVLVCTNQAELWRETALAEERRVVAPEPNGAAG
ncbi:glycerophosphoryl diester phosphodiesterase [Paenibacillus sp. J31TS4]|uniref:glycerophosphodiester phosphodiesterase n=1 Tax=Paenibacillus sp. J31TS4 TaxID=2807195 RepID=UPI001B22828A|nr:glycerophosphodiester phosphodiesterase family protein [Paenibacillus sp. J31TS4]GIP41388.1 glycerophosphoryl diester phosphodiesterase [Paenibacillus sp. J31TS4]